MKFGIVKKVAWLLLSLYITHVGTAQIIPLGSGSYTMNFPAPAYPAPFTQNGNFQYPGDNFYRTGGATGTAPKVTAGFTQPVQTNDWWSSAIWNYETNTNWLIAPYSFPMYPHPQWIQATRYGLNLAYEIDAVITNTIPGGDYHYAREPHLSIGLAGMDVPPANRTNVKSYGDWHVTMEWNDGAGRRLEATSAHGNPFTFFQRTAGTSDVTIRCQVAPTFYAPNSYFATISNATMEARGITIQLGNTVAHYGLFFPAGTAVNPNVRYALSYNEAQVPAQLPGLCCVNRDAFNATLPVGANYFSIAVLPDNNPATLATYANSAFAFVTNTQVSWSYAAASSQMTSTFTSTITPMVAGHNTTVQALYRHQWMNADAATNTAYTSFNKSYVSARGLMRALQSNTFSTVITNNGVLPSLPHALTAAERTTLYNMINTEYTTRGGIGPTGTAANTFQLDKPSDTYWGGKALGRLAELVHLAHQAGHYTARNAFLGYLKTHLQDWFTSGAGENNTLFYYSNTWKTLVGYPAGYDSDRQLNDHHFHYSYFVKAAATVAQYEPNNTWVTQWGPMVELLISDVANTNRASTMFPFLRCFDPYAGHSWASGHSNFGKGNNQESTSESLNFASAVALWGNNTGNTALRDLGIYLHSTEVIAAKQYWFDENNAVFPNANPTAPAAWNYGYASLVWGWGAENNIWFGWDAEYQYGINFLPLTGGSMYLGQSTAYVNAFYNEMKTYNPGPETVWRDLWWQYVAFADPTYAKSQWTALGATYTPEFGESKAHTYHWIENLDSIGRVEATVTADYPFYGVFIKGSCKTYVVHNPAASGVTVTFTDGRVLNVPADTLYMFNSCTTLPVELLALEAREEGEDVRVYWTTVSEQNSDYYWVERSLDGKVFERIGKVKAAGNHAGVLNYSFLDTDPYEGISYYRLNQVDLDGTSNLSVMVSVQRAGVELEAYPNPTGNMVFISGNTAKLQLSLTDMTGKVLSTFEWSGASMGEKYSLDLSPYAKGTYLIKAIDSSGLSKILKIVKME